MKMLLQWIVCQYDNGVGYDDDIGAIAMRDEARMKEMPMQMFASQTNVLDFCWLKDLTLFCCEDGLQTGYLKEI